MASHCLYLNNDKLRSGNSNKKLASELQKPMAQRMARIARKPCKADRQAVLKLRAFGAAASEAEEQAETDVNLPMLWSQKHT